MSFVVVLSASMSAAVYATRNYTGTFREFPSEEVRRSYEFPEPLRKKYKAIFGELDHEGKYVDPSEFHDNAARHQHHDAHH